MEAVMGQHRVARLGGVVAVLLCLLRGLPTQIDGQVSGVRAQEGACVTATTTPGIVVPTPRLGAPFCPNQLGPASDFTVFVLGDVNQSFTDTEGRMAVGRNATLNSFGVGDRLPNSHGSRDDLIVGNTLTMTGGQVFNGNAVYGVSQNVVGTGF